MQSDQPPAGDQTTSPLSPTPSAFATPPAHLSSPSPGQSSFPPPAPPPPPPPPPSNPLPRSPPDSASPSAPPTGGIISLPSRPRGNFMAGNKPPTGPSPPHPTIPGDSTTTPPVQIPEYRINKMALSENDKATHEAMKRQDGIVQRQIQAADGTFTTRLVRLHTPPSPLGQTVTSASDQQGGSSLVDEKSKSVLTKPFKSPSRSEGHGESPKVEPAKGREGRRAEDVQAEEQGQKAQQIKPPTEREEQQKSQLSGMRSNADNAALQAPQAQQRTNIWTPALPRDGPESIDLPPQQFRRPPKHIRQKQEIPPHGHAPPSDSRRARPPPPTNISYHEQDERYPTYQVNERHHDRFDDGDDFDGTDSTGHRPLGHPVHPSVTPWRGPPPYASNHQAQHADHQRMNHSTKLVRRVPPAHQEAHYAREDPFVNYDAPPKRSRDEVDPDPRMAKRPRPPNEKRQETPAPVHEYGPAEEKEGMGNADHGDEEEGEEEEEEDEDEEEDSVPFDPTAPIEPYDYVKELQKPWNEMMAEMVPFIDEWAEKFLAESLDTVFTVYQCFHKMSVKQGQSLQDGVDEILAQQKWQNGRRQTFIDFRKQMAKVALALGDIDPEDEEDMPLPAVQKRRA